MAPSRRSRRTRATTSSTRAPATRRARAMVQPTTVRSSASATRAMIGLVWPMGGRKSVGRVPVTRSSASMPRAKIVPHATARAAARRAGRARTSAGPRRAPPRGSPGRPPGARSALRPTRKNVAFARCAASVSSTRGVHLGCGPSSNVRATPRASRGPRTTASTKTRQRSDEDAAQHERHCTRRARRPTSSSGGGPRGAPRERHHEDAEPSRGRRRCEQAACARRPPTSWRAWTRRALLLLAFVLALRIARDARLALAVRGLVSATRFAVLSGALPWSPRPCCRARRSPPRTAATSGSESAGNSPMAASRHLVERCARGEKRHVRLEVHPLAEREHEPRRRGARRRKP